jgi:hypothetical protein
VIYGDEVMPSMVLAERGQFARLSRFGKPSSMSTLHEIKAAAATLAAEDRSELLAWLIESPDVWEVHRERLQREIESGMDESSVVSRALDMAPSRTKPARVRAAWFRGRAR